MPMEHRVSIFLKAADLIAGPMRDKVNAATMLGQSKTAYQAEIDTCELIDFLRFNVYYLQQFMTDSRTTHRMFGTASSTVRWKVS